MALNFNVGPYYDDFDEKNKFYRVLFRPGVAVQARELTQLQTILQNQVGRLGEHLFEEGAMVIPGHLTYDDKFSFIKLQDTNGSGTNVETFRANLVGRTFTGGTSGITGTVVATAARTVSDPLTIFVKYSKAASDNISKTAAQNEVLTFSGSEGYTASVENTTTATGYGTSVTVDSGIYYVNKTFCKVESQRLIISKYTQTASAKVGFDVFEEKVTPQNINTVFPDPSSRPNILDNAAGTPNYTAPGAHRYYIELKLAQRTLTDTALTNFVQLMQIEYGSVTKLSINTNYNILEETLARRTYDESGNYVVRPFRINVREHLNNGTNRGVYPASEGGLESKVAVGLEPGKAYVRGFELETLTTNYVPVDKARDAAQVNNVAVPFSLGSYVIVDNIYNLPNISSFLKVSLRTVATNTSRGNSVGAEIGTARIRVVEYDSGTVGEIVSGRGTTKYKIFLFDIKMNSGQLFKNVKSMYSGETPVFTADIVLDAVVDIVSGSTSYEAQLKNPSTNTLIVEMPYDTIKTIRSADGSIDTNYYVRRVYKGTLSSGQASLTAGVNEQFLNPYSAVDYAMSIDSTGATINLSSLHSDGTPRVTIGGTPTGKNLLVRVNDLGLTTQAFTIVATVYKSSAQEKSKTLTTTSVAIATPNTTPGNSDLLYKSDIYELTKVYMSPDLSTAATTSHTDVTDRYTLDNGQRDNFYDLGRITLKPGYSAPTGRLLVQFKYFSHGAGDYFSADSYTGQIAYDNIPSFTSKDTIYQLRDCLDFRPRVRDDGTSFVNDAGTTNGTGASISEIVKVGDAVRTDLQYYLARIDKVYIDFKGNFGVVKGVSALEPTTPRDPDDAMVLYKLYLNPYTFGPSDVIPTIIDNKRYTMRDIGKLESRIKNLEYYTSLSLLEKETADLQILNPVTNVDRYKNGFVVDPFYGHNIGDSGNADYHVSVDAENGECRPQFYEDSIRLEYNGAGVNVQRTGDLVTLPYTHTPLINQPYASETVNVNPYLVFTWFGDLILSPSGDDWKDTETRPDLIVDNQGLFTVVENLVDPSGVLGTVWNEWQTQWTGRTISEAQSGRTVNTIETIQSAQARSGIRTSVAPDTIQTSLGERIIDIRMVPFIRARRVRFKAVALKPNTRVWPFFDGVNVGNFCKPRGFTSVIDDAVDVEPNPNAVRHPDLTAGDITSGTNALITDANGTIEGEFYIPNTETLRFRTGTRTFRLCDSATANAIEITTSTERNYTASGLLETRQEVALREPNFIRTDVADIRTVSTSTIIASRVVDPLAQTFTIDQPGGAFITKVDLAFRTKDPTLPVTVQIRTVENGYPTSIIMPFAQVTKLPASVAISNDGSALTTFTFPSLVYLRQNVEYALVVLADTQQYNLWTATLGAFDAASGNRISQQPYMGSLFKSQNGSTWTADQLSDMKFIMHRASFNTSVTGGALFNNAAVPLRRLQNNPIYTTNGSAVVKVYHPNHGMTDTSYVIISGASGTDVNGIPIASVNGQHQIYDVEQDWYKITMGAAATLTGNAGGTAVFATENKVMTVVQPTINHIVLPETSCAFTMKLTTGKSLAGNESAYIKDVNYRQVIANQNYVIDRPYLIASQVNETQKMSGAKSFELVAALSSSQDNVSPVIDLERVSVFAITNRIDNPQVRGGTDTSKNQVDNYVSELSPSGGSALSKYITKKITLNSAASSLQVVFGANRPDGALIEVYYKTAVTGSDTRIEDKAWTQMNPDSLVTTSENVREFKDYTYTVNDIGNYTVFLIKVVFKSTNAAKVPRIRDFRAIALGT